eukprot:SAG11_NODE_128_length_15542_cov_6.432105_5_plen_101_part_00
MQTDDRRPKRTRGEVPGVRPLARALPWVRTAVPDPLRVEVAVRIAVVVEMALRLMAHEAGDADCRLELPRAIDVVDTPQVVGQDGVGGEGWHTACASGAI